MASVEQRTHQPLLLLIEECVAAATPDLQPESNLYHIITNKGYTWNENLNMSAESLVQTLEVKSLFFLFIFFKYTDVLWTVGHPAPNLNHGKSLLRSSYLFKPSSLHLGWR